MQQTPVQNYELTTLPGGVRIISETLPRLRSISLGFWIAAGSRYEQPGQGGISHFLEHLLFKGTPTLSAMEIAQAFDAMGAETNAATSKEYTVLYGRFVDTHLEQAFDLLSTMLLHPTFAELENEREVVLEEIAMYEDTPDVQVHDLLTQQIFGTHPLGRPVIGERSLVERFDRGSVETYHANEYIAPHFAVAAAGNVDHGALTTLARKAFTARASSPKRPEEAVAPTSPAQPAFYHKDTEQFHLCLGGFALAQNDERRFALSVLDAILGGSGSSRLFQEVREKRGLAYSVYSYTSLYKGHGMIGVYAGSRAENLPKVTQVICEELLRIANDPVESRELSRAKESLKGRIVLGMESTSARMNRLGRNLTTNMPILSLEEIMERYDAVSATDIRDLAVTFYDPAKLTMVAVGPDKALFEKVTQILPVAAAV